jgi:SlyX protein
MDFAGVEFQAVTTERLNDIETQLAHQDRQIADLSDIVLRQGREIETLQAKLRLAEERLSDVSQSLETSEQSLSATEIAARDKPPHY